MLADCETSCAISEQIKSDIQNKQTLAKLRVVRKKTCFSELENYIFNIFQNLAVNIPFVVLIPETGNPHICLHRHTLI